MLHMGFDSRWVNWIMECVSTVSYSISVNGEQYGYFKPSRGIRQGDPLSPFLFLICTGGLSSLLSQKESQGHLKGIKICCGGPTISHLLFADDSLMFCRASKGESEVIKDVLNKYRNASSQLVNVNKSSMIFSANTPESSKKDCRQVRGFSNSAVGSKYLGLPYIIGRDLKEKPWRMLKIKLLIVLRAGMGRTLI